MRSIKLQLFIANLNLIFVCEKHKFIEVLVAKNVV